VTSIQAFLSSNSAKGWNILTTITRDSFVVHVLHLPQKQSVVYLTDGLSEKRMDVPEKWQHLQRIELYFCIPDYTLPTVTEETTPWLLNYLVRIGEYFLHNSTWLGPGHTFTLKKEDAVRARDYQALVLLEPIWLREELNVYSTDVASIHFLGLTPLFKREFEQKQQKGYLHLYERLTEAGVSERLDDYRESVFKRKFNFF
jgi:hypothetical protein